MKNTLIAFALILFTACSSDDTVKDYTEENEQEIQKYITDNNLTPKRSDSGLYYIIDEQGTGDKPTNIGDRVKVKYKGYLTNGTVIDENEDGADFKNLRRLISGFIEGLTYFNEGGKGKIIIPSDLAYGNRRKGKVSPGDVIIFDIEIIYVNYKTENEAEIQKYLTDNDLTAERTNSGLYYIIENEGTGESPKLTSNDVTIKYKAYTADGVVFDESKENVSSNAGKLIKGLSKGLTFFKEGGNGTLFIPTHLAYGNDGNIKIPTGAIVIFDVTLVSVD